MKKKRRGRIIEFQRNSSEINPETAREERRKKLEKSRKRKTVDDNTQRVHSKKKAKLNKTRLILAAIIIFVIAFVGVQVKNIIDLKQEQSALLQQQEQLKNQKEDLKEEYANINSKEYIEQQARELLRMVKPNEKIFIIEAKEKNSTEEKDGENNN